MLVQGKRLAGEGAFLHGGTSRSQSSFSVDLESFRSTCNSPSFTEKEHGGKLATQSDIPQ